MTDAYRTLRGPTTARLSRQRSRFLAYLEPVASIDEADDRLAVLRRAHHDAAHHCSAVRLFSPSGPISRADDDGEPSGSAGAPILQHLEGANLYDVLAVVVRYFGGAKLGIGGLVRAYGDAVRAALDRADVVVRRIEVEASISFPAEVHSGVMSTIHRFNVSVREISFTDRGRARVRLPPSRFAAFADALREVTGGRAELEVRR